VRVCVCVCVCVCVEVTGTSGPPQTPDGAKEILFTETRECVGQQTRNPIVYSRSYRRVRRGIAVWVVLIENAKEYFFLYSIQDRLKTIMQLVFVDIVTRWSCLVWCCVWLILFFFFAIYNNRPTKCAQPFSLLHCNCKCVCK
jgi:hypothetical protein